MLWFLFYFKDESISKILVFLTNYLILAYSIFIIHKLVSNLEAFIYKKSLIKNKFTNLNK